MQNEVYSRAISEYTERKQGPDVNVRERNMGMCSGFLTQVEADL